MNQDSDDSDEEEEQNSIKTDHDHKQYELTMKAIRETLLKKPDDKSHIFSLNVNQQFHII